MARRPRHAAVPFTAGRGDAEHLPVDAYLAELAAGLHPPANIGLALRFAPLSLEVDRAICLGLVLNELAKNAILHAWPDGRRGELRLSLEEKETGVWTLLVQDDGLGCPWPPPRPGLGLRMLGRCCAELGARLSVRVHRGSSFSLEFEAEVRAPGYRRRGIGRGSEMLRRRGK